MQIDKDLLLLATVRGILKENQADELWQFFKEQNKNAPHFNFTQILYYLGGLIAIAAMTLFMTLGWEKFGGFAILLLAMIYAAIALKVTHYFFSKKLVIPAGIAATFVIVCAPLAIYGFQKGMGWWPENYNYRDYHTTIQGLWVLMELGTLFVGAILFYLYRRPFLLMPVAITIWYLSMDLVPFFFPINNTWEIQQAVSLYMGILTVLFAFWIDLRTKGKLDYAFHLYFWGVIMFWGALSSMHSDSEWNKLIYCLINLVLIFIGAVLSRRVFVIFGAIGITFYLGEISYRLFRGSAWFPIFLTLLGSVIIYLGVLWSKYGDGFGKKLRANLPKVIQDLVARRHNLE